MTPWLDAAGRFFNPDARVSVLPLFGEHCCVVVDDVLAKPEGLRDWAAQQSFAPPRGYPYPGLVLDAPGDVPQRLADAFALHARKGLGGRRTLDHTVRLSMVTMPPAELEPRQWQCHRDRVADDPRAMLFAASVLYLFRNPALGGTSFYVPRQSAATTDQMLADSQRLSAAEFSARHGVQCGYMAESNDYFERVAQVPAAWNRAIFYDGGLFHSGDVEHADALSADPMRGRLTLNGFFSCKRTAV